MKNGQKNAVGRKEGPLGFPSSAQLAALRAWYQGIGARAACVQYLNDVRASGQSSRAMLGKIRRQVGAFARSRHRDDLAALFQRSAGGSAADPKISAAIGSAIEQLRNQPPPQPLIGDPVERWFSGRTASTLQRHGIQTLAELTLRVPRRKRWWAVIPGLGQRSALQVEAFFAEHPALTERAHALVVKDSVNVLAPWERMAIPLELDGAKGAFRAPAHSCALSANNDVQAVSAWLALQEAPATQRAYRKEAERLMLWAVYERGKALSSLTVEDAIAYRSFLRRPSPRARWVGPAVARASIDWRPFVDALSARSIAYAVSVLGALFRWLIEQGYLLVNPFSGLKVRGATRASVLDLSRVFSPQEWSAIRGVAEHLEASHGWSQPAADRLRFMLDFGYSTGLRAGELVAVKLGDIQLDQHGDWWTHLVGKGAKAGKVAMPGLARAALDRYLVQRGISTIQAHWRADIKLLVSLGEDGGAISPTRLRVILRRFFETAAQLIERNNPASAQRIRRGTPHWLRHTHATHALEQGAELTTVRDNLRHASIATTSVYLHGDDAKRANQIGRAFSA